MSAAFTPQSWSNDGLTVNVHGRGTIATIPTPQNGGVVECSANARLIAAAPDLYEELAQNADGCSTIISLLRGQTSPVAASLIGMLQIQEQSARAALAKARGQ